jgi:hypothetical protein
VSIRATRCDHVHPHSDLSDHSSEIHHHASSVEFTPTGTIAATTVQAAIAEVASEAASGAPTTADYLVGTAQGGLSAEIVVGTTPGGELGGTWASPTVDATHSGSTHSAATDTHIADATDAHDASAISIVDSGAHFTSTDVEGALQELGVGSGVTAASIAAFGFVGQILISDTPSTPLVFADLIQNEAQNDLVYEDLG